MRRLLTAIALIGAPLAAVAEEPALPALFRVTGVETRLNVRAAPAIDAAVIGALAPDTGRVEVTALDPTGQWAAINLGEAAGWVSRAFVAPEAEGGIWAENALPEALRCFGTEPFWNLRRDGDTLIRGGIDMADRALRIEDVTGTAGAPSRVVVARDGHGTLTLGIAPEECSDGMSDRRFGLGARVSEGDAPALIGCCSVAP